MDSNEISSSRLHYHIHWSTAAKLDWQAFETREEADALARDIARSDESYTIEAANGDCERCRELARPALSHSATASGTTVSGSPIDNDR
jgi:hypothetical protein